MAKTKAGTRIDLVSYASDEEVEAVEKFLQDLGFKPSTKRGNPPPKPITISVNDPLSEDQKAEIEREFGDCVTWIT